MRSTSIDQSEGMDVLFSLGEGHFRFVCSRHRRTNVIIADCIGHMNEASWGDESDPTPVFIQGLERLADIKPTMLVWNFADLQSISVFGLAHLEGCHTRLVSNDCETAMVINDRLRPVIAFNHLLTRCQIEKSVAEAIWFVYLNRWQAA